MDWSEYRGVNLIGERGFAALDGDPEQPVWEQRDGTTEFLVWEDATTEDGAYPAVPDALTGSPVYRLEMKNILANGDFENVAAGSVPAGWQSVGATNAEVITTDDFNASDRANGVDLASLHGERVLLLNYESPQERFFLDLSAATGLTDTVPPEQIVVQGRALALFVDFRTPVDSFTVALNNEPTATDVQSQLVISRGPENDATYRYPGQDRSSEEAASEDPARNQLSISDTTYSSFSMGGFTATAESRTDAIIDNLRLTRNDLDHAVFLRVPYIEPLDPDRPEIVGGGSYTVSFWVAQDATAGSNNRFTPRYMWVSLVDTDADNPFTRFREIFLEDASVVDQWGSGWSRIEVEFSGPQSFSYDQDSNPTAFELEIGLGGNGNSAKQYPGSLMIAAPELVFSP